MDAFSLGEYYTTAPSCSTSGYKRSYTPSSTSNALVSTGSSGGTGGFYSAFGGLAAGRLGTVAGTYLDNAGGITGLFKSARNWIGMGDYELRSNSLIRNSGSGDVEIVTSGPRGTRIRFKEYIGDVFTHPTEAGKFHAVHYEVNPGLAATFPWLSPIAQQYDQWTPNGIIFEFKSTSSEYVATQALGSVIMASEYDVYDAPYTSKIEMLNSAYSNEAKPSQHIIHGLECDPRDNPEFIYYTRSSPVCGGDIRDYDLCRFTVATQGGSTVNLNLGSLYINYDITFRKEQLSTGVLLKNQAFVSYAGTMNDAEMFQDMVLVDGYNPGFEFLEPTASKGFIRFPSTTVGYHWLVMVYGELAETSSAPGLSSPLYSYPSPTTTVGLTRLEPDPIGSSVPNPTTASNPFKRTGAAWVCRQDDADAVLCISGPWFYSSGLGTCTVSIIQVSADFR